MTLAFHDRAYRDANDLTAMQTALARWIQLAGVCGYCHVGDFAHWMFNGLRGLQPVERMVHLWLAGGDILGMGFLSRHGDFDAFVHPAFRGVVLERRVIEWCIEGARAILAEKEEASDPITTGVFECDVRRIGLLQKMGFQPYTSEAPMVLNARSLDGDLPPIKLPDGFIIRSAAGDDDAAELAAVHSSAFGSSWTAKLYRDEVMHKPGYALERELVVVAPDGRFAAFCLLWLDELNGIGYFEPVGVHADFQRRGLGRALMAYGLNQLRRWGMTTAQVVSETDNEASSRLYRSMGFSPTHRIIWYSLRE